MPKKTARITDKVFARVDDDLARGINAIVDKHNTEPAVLVRGLLEAAVAFYDAHGWFSFPVRIEPEAFQAQYVAELQAKYGTTPVHDFKSKEARAQGAADALAVELERQHKSKRHRTKFSRGQSRT